MGKDKDPGLIGDLSLLAFTYVAIYLTGRYGLHFLFHDCRRVR